MYYDFYHLKQNPFAEAPDPAFLFLGRGHKTVLHAIIRALEEQQGLIAVFGAAGLGKTILLRAVQERLHQQLGQTILLRPANCTFSTMLTTLCEECGLNAGSASPATMLGDLRQTLLHGHKSGWRVVVMIDDAHQMPASTFASLLQLSELQTPLGEPLLPIVFTGVPALQRILNLPQFRPLKKRLAVRVTLHAMTTEESLSYVRHRLTKVLMPEDALFTAGALKRIVRMAQGNPRALNMLCSNLLSAGALRQQKPVPVAIAREVLAGLQTQHAGRGIRWGKCVATALALVAGLWWGWQGKAVSPQPFHQVLEPAPGGPGSPVPADLLSGSMPAQDVPAPTPKLAPKQTLPKRPVAPTAYNTPQQLAAEVPALPTRDPAVPPLPPAATHSAPPAPIVPQATTVPQLRTLDRQRWRASETTGSGASSPATAWPQAVRRVAQEERPSVAGATAQQEVVATVPVHTVHFHSLPEAATVTINGKVRGRTPVMMQLPMGSYTIVVEKAGHSSKNYRLDLQSAGESHLYHDLPSDFSGQ
jgi:general secretion pathway protein A